jgi:predicted protein tyrosine phosphatase
MAHIHVCSLDQIDDVAFSTGARSLITLLNVGTRVTLPAAIAPHRHLFIGVSDIVEPRDGYTLPTAGHIGELLNFVKLWDRVDPLLIACFAAVSRSTAAAFIIACALEPAIPEDDHAQRLRTASPTATPNAKLVAIADGMLNRDGRMIAAVAAIGRGEDCFSGAPFAMDLR